MCYVEQQSYRIIPIQKRTASGCLLSPILFALFLNDLNDFLLEKAEGITLWDTCLRAMLYADDLI